MTDHTRRVLSTLGEGDAPAGVDVEEVAHRVARRRRRRAAAGAALAACAVALPLGWVAVATGGSGTTAPAAPPASCPSTMTRTPPPPSPDLGLGDRLVPETVPDRVTLCRYASDDGGRLTGSRVVADGTDAMVADLREVRDAPRTGGCLIGSRKTPYLALLQYPEGPVWVAAYADDTCGYQLTTTTNGVATFDHVGNDLARAYRDSRWRGLGEGSPCATPPAHRRGTDTEMVPSGVVDVTVCRARPGGSWTPEPLTVPARDELVELLGSAPGQDDLGVMRCTKGGAVPDRRVVLRYAAGPPVSVAVSPDCDPPVTNDVRAGELTDRMAQALGYR